MTDGLRLFLLQVPDLDAVNRGFLSRRVQGRFKARGNIPAVDHLPVVVLRGEDGLRQEIEVSSSYVYSRPQQLEKAVLHLDPSEGEIPGIDATP